MTRTILIVDDEEKYATFSLTDNGSGIFDKNREKIFTPFLRRTEKEGEPVWGFALSSHY